MNLQDRIRRFHRRNLSLGYYPCSFRSAMIFVPCFIIISSYTELLSGVKPNFQAWHDTASTESRDGIVTHALVGLVLWMILGMLRKIILRRLLTYRGWMFEGNVPSLKTKLFIVTIRLLCGWSKPISSSLYDLQSILPSLPVPKVKDTLNQYLESIEPLVDSDKFQELKTLAAEFAQKSGQKLQRYLILKSWLAPNYISDWWEDYVYLKCRGSLLIDSNYYAVDTLQETTPDQASRAALLTYSAVATMKKIEDCTFEPIIAQGVIPLCAWQVERMFNTTRVPGENIDTMQHEQFSDHIVVHHKGRYFKVNIYQDSRQEKLLSPAEFKLQFSRILEDTSEPDLGEDKLAALTAWDRTSWARARQNYFKGGNKSSLDSIETSAFVVNLDEEQYSMKCLQNPGSQTPGYAESSRRLFHGNGCNLWLDKSINFIVFKNGQAGGCGEHTWGDAPVGAHLWEIMLRFGLDFEQLDEKGVITTPVKIIPPHPEKLKWKLSEECLEDIDSAAKEALKAIDNLDLKVLAFSRFGKGHIKTCKVSPDAFLQMTFQLAYYRDQGKFDLTYESSMTRFYLQGRTETVRVCTPESCEWVRSMEDDLPRNTKIELFRKACERHQKSYRSCMNGKGIDRHLFGLYVVSKYLKIESPFLNEAIGHPWRLSTSQTPTRQTNLKPTGCWGGGFGPVAADGYGVSYIVAGEDKLYFHITSKKSAPNTDSDKFCQQIERALADISEMFSS